MIEESDTLASGDDIPIVPFLTQMDSDTLPVIQHEIEQRAGGSLPSCQVCGKEEWYVHRHLLAFPHATETQSPHHGQFPYGRRMEFVALVCVGCSHSLFFAAQDYLG